MIFKTAISHLHLPVVISCLVLLVACDDSDSSKSKLEEQKPKSPSITQKNAHDSDASADKPKDFAELTKGLAALQAHEAQEPKAIEILKDAVKISPKQTAEWLVTLPPGLKKDACIETAFKLWASESPTDAAQFAKNHLKGVDYRLALASVIEGVADVSPKDASALLAGENEPLMRGALIDSLITGAIDDNAAFLADWTSALPPGNDRDRAIASLVKEWSARQPVECEKWLTRALSPEEKAEHGVTLITNWASIDPREARAWIDGQTDPELKNSASIALVESWAFVDPAGASQWAAKLQDPVMKKSALETIAAAWIVNDPNGAIEWASKLPDTGQQQSTLTAGFERLAGESQAALIYWIEKNPGHPAQIFAKNVLSEQ